MYGGFVSACGGWDRVIGGNEYVLASGRILGRYPVYCYFSGAAELNV